MWQWGNGELDCLLARCAWDALFRGEGSEEVIRTEFV